MEKEDINEILIVANHAKESGFKQISLDPNHVIELCNLALLSANKYYCVCNNSKCGNWFELAIEGDKCPKCKTGTLYPQDVEPY